MNNIVEFNQRGDVPVSTAKHKPRPFKDHVFVPLKNLSAADRARMTTLVGRGGGDTERTITRSTTRIVVADRLPPGGVFKGRDAGTEGVTSLWRTPSMLHLGTVELEDGRRLVPDDRLRNPVFVTIEELEWASENQVWDGPTPILKLEGPCPRLGSIRSIPFLDALPQDLDPDGALAAPVAGPSGTSSSVPVAEDAPWTALSDWKIVNGGYA